jgi:hypothetical protein
VAFRDIKCWAAIKGSHPNTLLCEVLLFEDPPKTGKGISGEDSKAEVLVIAFPNPLAVRRSKIETHISPLDRSCQIYGA